MLGNRGMEWGNQLALAFEYKLYEDCITVNIIYVIQGDSAKENSYV